MPECLLASLVNIGVPSSDLVQYARVAVILVSGLAAACVVQRRLKAVGVPLLFIFVIAADTLYYVERLSVAAVSQLGFDSDLVYSTLWREFWQVLPPVLLIGIGFWLLLDTQKGAAALVGHYESPESGN